MSDQGLSHRLLRDSAILTRVEDKLGYGKYAEAFADLIVSPELSTPFTIGVFGDWGAGKTSMMLMIKALIDERGLQRTHTIWFDAWKFDKKEPVWEALIQTIFLEMLDDPSSEGFRDELLQLSLKFLAYMTSTAVKIGTVGVIDPIALFEEAKKVINIRLDEIRFINRFETNFAKVVTRFVGEAGKLVIFIDDLDRCLPENAVEVLEAIKLFLGQPNCVFVVGIDKRVIENGIRIRYGDRFAMSGADYLEKIIQLPFVLPAVRDMNVAQYINSLAGVDINEKLKLVIQSGSDNNPRRIKRFLNTFALLRYVADSAELDQVLLAKVIMIQISFPDFYKELISAPIILINITNAINATQQEQHEFLSRHPRLTRFMEDARLRDFLSTTKQHTANAISLKPYLELTHTVYS